MDEDVHYGRRDRRGKGEGLVARPLAASQHETRVDRLFSFMTDMTSYILDLDSYWHSFWIVFSQPPSRAHHEKNCRAVFSLS